MVDVNTGPQPIIKGPTKLGEYTLLRRIGRGGMAEVYLAKKDGDLVDRNLVVKRMLPHLADDERFVQMFMREARVAMQLSHPNVVQMLEVGVEGEEYFIAMEHLEGLSAYHLAKRVWAAGGSLPLELIAHTLCDSSLGLEHAHNLKDIQGNHIGLVHRDISPDNIFVTKDGTSKILDFGIALGAFAGSLTRTGEIKGKVRYMSPEQMTKATGVDARADVFSLGATLYWLLTGRHAFDGDNDVMAMRSVLESEPLPPSALNDSLPSAIDDVVSAMLKKNRDHRVPSAEAAYEMLLPFGGGAAGRAKVVEFLRSALVLPPVKKRAEGELETPLAVPASVPWAAFGATAPNPPAPGASPSSEATFPTIMPPGSSRRSLEATVRMPVPMSSETPTDTPPEHGTEAGAAPTSSTPFSHVDGETLENALRPKPPARKRSGLVLIAAAAVLGITTAAVGFVVLDPLSRRPTTTTNVDAGVAVAVADAPNVLPVDAPPVVDTRVVDTPVVVAAPVVPATTVDAGVVAARVVDAGAAIAVAPVPPVVPVVAPVLDVKVDVKADQANTVADAGVAVVAANDRAVDKPDDKAVVDKPDDVKDPKDEPVVEPVIAESGREPVRTKRAAPKSSVKAKGPGFVEWRTVGGALLGKGNDTLALPRDTRQIVAHDTKRRGKTRVDVDDEIDYGALAKGELSVIAVPYAEVFLGKENLGRTPINGISVVAGTYDVKLVFEGKTKTVKITVDAGEKENVRANMNQ